jgi:penicillin amidase
VNVVRDAQGVPHINAASLDDLFFAQGYVTAQDRLWQMDMSRRYASGRLSEILGSKYVEMDVQQRTLLMPVIAERAAAALEPRDRGFMEAYARGVNAFIEANHNHLPIEFRVLQYSPQPWTVVDSMLVGAGMSEMLNLDQLENVLQREKVMARVGPEFAADLYPNSSFRDHPPVNGVSEEDEFALDESQPDEDSDAAAADKQAGPTEPRQPRRRARRRSRRANSPRSPKLRRKANRTRAELESAASLLGKSSPGDLLPDAGPLFPGSNNWVVSGAHTASGKPLLSNDMHLPHQIPNTWYEVHLTSGSFDVAGVSLPGVPFVIAGHNQRIAWGFTNIGPAVTDLYAETFNDKGEYLTPEGWKQAEHREEHIRVRWGRDVNVDVAITRHGPVVSRIVPGEKRMLALKWVLHDPAGMREPFFDINSAQNWDEFRRAFSLFGSPGQNVVYVDVDGHIGYQATGLVPIRPATITSTQPAAATSAVQGSKSEDSAQTAPALESGRSTAIPGVLDQEQSSIALQILPGADNAHEWAGYVPFDKLPSSFDPPSGVIATANGRITPGGYPYLISAEWGSGYRTERIYRVLGGDRKFTAANMLELQTDVYSDFDRFCAQRFVYAVDRSPSASARAKQAAEIMRAWDGQVTADSAGASIVSVSRQQLIKLLLEPKLGADYKEYRWFMSSVWLENLLLMQPARWLPPAFKSYDDLLSAAVDQAVKHDSAPRNLNNWKWGKMLPVKLQHPLFGMIPLLRRWSGPGQHEQSGNGYTVKQVGRSFGPSERMTADMSNLDASTLNIVTGQSGNIFSRHYMDQWKAWYEGKTFVLPFSSSAVQSSGTQTLVLEPAR